MDELKRLNKILNIELAIVVISIVVMGIGVFLVFQQLTLRLDAIATQTENSEAIWALKDIVSWQSEYEVEFRSAAKEEYAQKFWSTGEQFDSIWKEARAKIILFDPKASFFYKSNNLRHYHLQFQAIVSEIFTHVREGTLEEAEDLIEQHEILEEKMVEIIDEWQELNKKNLISLRSDANRFTATVFWMSLLSLLLISASFITISRRFFAPSIRNLVRDLTNRTKELERTKKALEKSKTALEIKVKTRTKELQKLAESLEEQVKKRTKTLESTNKELIKKSLDLKKSEENMKIFMKGFESSPNSQAIVEYKNNEPRILRVNDAFLNYYGYPKKKVIGKNPHILKSGVHNKYYYKKMWETILNPEIGFWRSEIVNKRKDGSLFNIILTIRTIFDEKKNPIYFFASHVDITKRKKAEEILREQNEDLLRKSLDLTELGGQIEDKNIELETAIGNLNKQNKDLIEKTMDLTELQGQIEDKNFELEGANKEILELMKARTEFISRAAHDLRTPITPIMLLLPTIKKRIKDKGILYDISIIERNANYLRLIANNLISYLKSQTGKYTYVFKKNNMGEIIDEVIKIYGEAFKQHKISVKKNIIGKLPLVEMDDLKITEVIQNIVSNALKFMPKGGRFTISAKKIDNLINIRFQDTGIGMKKDALSKIFGEFFKADVSRHIEGEGLGLSICKEIIEDHNGRIWAESGGRGKGSAILFEIPIKQKSG